MKYVIKHLFVTLIFVYVISFCSSSSFLAAEPDTDSEVTHGRIIFYEDVETSSSTSNKDNHPTQSNSNQYPVSNKKTTKGLLPQTSDYCSYFPTAIGLILILGVVIMYRTKWSVRVV
ncbi:hypothetical protein [Vagococcus luciliae]|uniref:Gram-positive cocci surface proteins LPxTG domain-containing protein n=1 Tax=Vagococcus luciliae TaxID=2920380 RepID=A0ABY5NXK3_9ENTE|nr:hypothetical protein [Vagococcus luciliae]UUV98374.1 hypothetical protein G314FT_04900 [Vagococcus luciliae]